MFMLLFLCTIFAWLFIAAALASVPPGRERFIGSVDATWAALQRPESRALVEIIIATRHDPELAARIADFAQRFDAGITDSVEVSQAQSSVASAELDYINSVFAHNVAKLSLARAAGGAVESLPRFLKLQ